MRTRVITLLLVLAGSSPAAAQQPAGGEPSAPKLTKAPKLVQFVAADYPEAEKAAGREASVTLELVIGADGKVSTASVTVSAGAAFDAAALAAVVQFVFEPAEIDGKPAPVKLTYRYDFSIETTIEQPTTAQLAGTVRDAASKQPLAGITVDLGEGLTATTGADGRFAIDGITPGKQVIKLSGQGITALQTEEELEVGKKLEVIYDVSIETPDPAGEPGDDLEIVVTAPRLERSVASVEIIAGQARKLPGTGGDVLKVVDSMPGVARAAAGSSALVVWGAAPQDTRSYVDGVRIPVLYHKGGLRSVVAADMVKSLELVPGGYGAPYGRGLGGLVLVGLTPLAPDKVSGSVSADAIDSAAVVKFPIAGKLSAAVSARRSQLDWVLDQVSDEEISELFPVPSYHDGQLRLGYQITPRQSIELAAMLSSDRVTRTVASRDPGATKNRDERLDFFRVWLGYHHQLDDGAAVDAVVYGGGDDSSLLDRFGAAETELASDAGVYGGRASWRRQLTPRLALSLGIDGEFVDAQLRRTGSVSLPAREGDVFVFGQPPPDQMNSDDWEVITGSLAPYVESEIAVVDRRLRIAPGLRIEPFFLSASRRTPVEGATPAIGLFDHELAVQPRLSVTFDVTRRLGLRAAWGQYRQPPSVEDLSAVFGSPVLPNAEATHYVAGARYRFTDTLSSELTGFITTSERLAVRSPSTTPQLAQALVPDGSGRALGGQLLVRQDLWAGLFGWLSYSVLRSERTDQPDAEARLFDFDQTHVVTGVVAWQLPRGFELGARARYATGMPRTPVVGAYFDSRRDLYQPMFGEHNSDRLPAFVEIDLRAALAIELDRQQLEIYVDLHNASNRDNAEEVVYSTDFTRKSYIQGLPILPIVGARLSW